MIPTVAPAISILWIVIAFAAGSLPFSVWIGRWVLRADIRAYGDANPGATNVLRAGGRGAFAAAALLDGFKAAIPVGLAWLWADVGGWPLALVAAAPLAGHAFSPFLGGKGGKAVATTFGAWAGLTIWEGPTILGLGLLLTTRIVRNSGWAVISAMGLLLIWMLATPPAWNGLALRPPPGVMLLAWLLQMAILVYKHRHDLAQPPRWRRSGLPPAEGGQS
jgi:glycerol-3-phosphate acyltransferase PlsY